MATSYYTNTALFATTVQNAKLEKRDEGGVHVYVPAKSFSCDKLKMALDNQFGSEYSVQLRKDVFKITLPNSEFEDIEQLKYQYR